MQQQHETLGNTFRGAGGSGTRRAFFGKTDGQAELQRDMLVVASPVSGCVLAAPDAARQAAIKDPISGTTLHLSGNHANIITPVLKQHQVHAKKFYLSKDIDIQIALLRQTNTVNQHTNEKVGTAGCPTGLDPALLAGGKLRCARKHDEQQQQQQQQQQLQQPDAQS